MRLLVLGGTLFLGRHVVDAALARGHDVTLFHRGRTNAGLFPELEHVLGDREESHAALAGRRFDAVVDTSGYVPRVVRDAVETLDFERYLFVSSISAYAEEATRFDEDAPVGALPEESEDVSRFYGELKAACEEVVRGLGERGLVVRPGLVVGPHDPTNRFTYWVTRIAAGGEVLAPAPPGRRVQTIDVRDLAGWLVLLLEHGESGTFNAIGDPLALGELLEECRRTSGSDARFTWVDDSLLVDAGIEPYRELPLWIPLDDPASARFGAVPNAKAKAHGLSFRPLADTVAATLEWARAGEAVTGSRVVAPGGLAPERERELLARAAA